MRSLVFRFAFFFLFLALSACGGSTVPVGEYLQSCDTPNQSRESSCLCQADAECTEDEHGECVGGSWGRGYPPDGTYIQQQCRYPTCAVDDDCRPDRACRRTARGVLDCVPSTCRSDADCSQREGGVCRELSTRSFAHHPEVHCVYDDSVCDPAAGRACPPHGQDSSRPDDVCVFDAGVAACHQDPGPVP